MDSEKEQRAYDTAFETVKSAISAGLKQNKHYKDYTNGRKNESGKHTAFKIEDIKKAAGGN